MNYKCEIEQRPTGPLHRKTTPPFQDTRVMPRHVVFLDEAEVSPLSKTIMCLHLLFSSQLIFFSSILLDVRLVDT